MPRRNHRPQRVNHKTAALKETERQQRRERDAELGGWYNRFKIERRQREQQNIKEKLQ